MDQGKKLTQEEAQEVCRGFLLYRYPDAKIVFDNVVLTTKEAAPIYCVEGSIKRPLRSLLSQLFRVSEQYTFKMKVSALESTILSWELD